MIDKTYCSVCEERIVNGACKCGIRGATGPSHHATGTYTLKEQCARAVFEAWKITMIERGETDLPKSFDDLRKPERDFAFDNAKVIMNIVIARAAEVAASKINKQARTFHGEYANAQISEAEAAIRELGKE